MAKKNAKAIIEANLDNIEKWTANGLTVKQIATNLGLSDRTLYRHMRQTDSRLSQSVKKGREVAVTEIEGAMFNSAKGYTRIVKKYYKVKHTEFDPVTGKKVSEYEDIVEKLEEVYYPPDNTAGIFLLKNWGGYMNEPATVELRKQEVELRKKQVEANTW